MKTVFILLACTFALGSAELSRQKRQLFSDCLNKAGAYCDYSCEKGYTQDPSLRCGLITSRVCCTPNNELPPGQTTITPPLNICGVSKYGTEAGKMQSISSTDKIVNGIDAFPHEFPWIISLQFDNEHACGGSLIAKQWVMTAAHCFEGVNTNSPFSLSKIRIVSGEHRLLNADGTEVYSKVSRAFVHENYNKWTTSNDIALIKLSAPVPFDSNIREVCLPNSTIGNLDRNLVMVSGWGVLKEGAFVTPNTLQKVQLATISNTQCSSQMSGQGKIDSSMLCASGDAKDSCQGDSGGPLIMRSSPTSQQFVQVGIVSWGIGCASGLPGIYTRVSQFTSWIAQTIANN